MENHNKSTRKQFLHASALISMGLFIPALMSCSKKNGDSVATGSNIKCADCAARARYDRDPNSLLGRLWKWHTGWCPGWKSYLASLPEEERKKNIEKYR